MNADSINLGCEMNHSKDLRLERRFETEKSPEERHIGTGRHFFSKVLMN